MKILTATTIALFMFALSVFGQGAILFRNSTNNIVTDQYGNGLTYGIAELYYNPFQSGQWTLESSTARWTSPGVFDADINPIQVSSMGKGVYELKIRVYDPATPNLYTESQPFTYMVQWWDQRFVSPPTTMDGMNSFAVTMTPVPEPSAAALTGLGTAGLLIFRKRKETI